jgi:hypothetical protein
MSFEAAFWQINDGSWVAKIIGLGGGRPGDWAMINQTVVLVPTLENLDHAVRVEITKRLGIDGDMVTVNLRYLTNINPGMLSDDDQYQEEVNL